MPAFLAVSINAGWLTMPTVPDVTFGPTAEFIETRYEANHLLTDAPPGEAWREGPRSVRAAEFACAAGTHAVTAAERVGAPPMRRARAGAGSSGPCSVDHAVGNDQRGERDHAHDSAARNGT
jgi:hypothetical protein